MSKLPKSTLNLKQFLLQQEVKKLYRELFKTLRHVSDESYKKELIEWTRNDFKKNKYLTDDLTIKHLVNHGREFLKELKASLHLTK